MVRHAVLIGLMGSGKTSIGRILAERSGRPLLDSDALLAEDTGETAAEIAGRDGMDELHRLEGDVLRRALRHPRPAVITAPASFVDEPAAPGLLAGHHVIWARADPSVLAERVADGGHRPLLDGATESVLRLQADRRTERYRSLADLVVDTGVLDAEQAAGPGPPPPRG